MSTSATERTAFLYLIATASVAIWGGIYEYFSHGVWSPWMVYAFLFPLVLGALPFAWRSLHRQPIPRPWVCRLHHAGVATLTIGSIVEGVLAIYGTTNHLTMFYWIIGAGLLILAQLLRLFHK